MFDPGWVFVIYVFNIGVGALLVVGLDRCVDIERWLGFERYRCAQPVAKPLTRSSRTGSIENPVICPSCGAVNERDYSYCWTFVSPLSHGRVSVML